MLQMHFQTSSTSLIPINDFHYIYELARCAKCQNYILLQSTNTLYGFPADCSCIHEIPVPFKVNTDLTFGFESVKKEMLENDGFFIPDKFCWFILPNKYWDRYSKGFIDWEFDLGLDRYVLFDKETGPIDHIPMSSYRLEINFVYQKMIQQLEGFFNRLYTLSNRPVLFTGMESNDTIRNVYDNKVSLGRNLIKLSKDNTNVAFYIFKSLFALAKSDTLDIEIRHDIYQTNLFMATFKPYKKRNPIAIPNPYKVPFSEKIHCMYINVYM